MKAEPGFLNVDLVVWSERDLAPLIGALAPAAFDLHGVVRRGRLYMVAFELSRQYRTADATLRRLAAVVAGMPGAAKRHWHAAVRRDFDIGLEADTSGGGRTAVLSAEAVRAVAKVGGRILATVYPVPERRSPHGAARPPARARSTRGP